MTWRVLVSLCGVAVIGAATHANVLHAGGYGADAAPLIIAMAALLTVGMGFVGILWSERRLRSAIGLAVCILAGEVYWLCINAEREVAQREQQEMPTAAARDRRIAAERRLEEAKAGKRTADVAAVEEAANPGCKVNCAQLLSAGQLRATQQLAEARASLSALPQAVAVDGLPTRLGVVPWAWDLWMAALRSIGVMGASIGVGLALHSRAKAVSVLPVTGPEPRSVRRSAPAQIEQFVPNKKRAGPPRHEVREHVSEFMMEWVRPDPVGTASLRELHERYLPWCKNHAKQPLPASVLGRELRLVVDAIGLLM